MNTRALCTVLLLCAAQATLAADNPADEDDKDDTPASASPRAVAPPPPAELADFCFIATTPPAGTYTVVRSIKLGKGTYGKIWDILPAFAERAKRLGADAVIEYDGAQRFGFFPWRMVRPVVRGVAVKWTQPPTVSCAALGGSTLQAIMATDQAPARVPQAAAAASAPAQ